MLVFRNSLCHHERMKPRRAPEMIEGPEAWNRFESAMRKVLSVPHAVIQQKIADHREQAAKNPNRRGPKPKKATT